MLLWAACLAAIVTGAPCPNLSCKVFANSTACRGANATVARGSDCVPPFCFRCVAVVNATSVSQVAACGATCDVTGVTWSVLQASVCGFGVGLTASVQCAAVSGGNTTSPIPALSEGAVAGILVGFAVAIGVAVFLYCWHAVRQQEQRRAKLQEEDQHVLNAS
jgi:hypothetical protein